MKIAGILSALAQILIAGAIASIAYAAMQYIPTAQKFVDNTAKHDCAMEYRLEFLDAKANTTVSRPIEDLYQECLTDKKVN